MSTEWSLVVIDASGQPMDSIFYMLEDGTDRFFFQNVGSTNQRCVTSQKSAGLQNYIDKATNL
jgi:hypothetical protein